MKIESNTLNAAVLSPRDEARLAAMAACMADRPGLYLLAWSGEEARVLVCLAAISSLQVGDARSIPALQLL